jgi:hypothetical protein
MRGRRDLKSVLAPFLLITGLLYAQGNAQQLTADPSSTLIVNAAPGDKLAFGQQPVNTPAGATISPSVTVQLKDKSDKNVARAGVSVSLTLSSGTGVLSGTRTRATDAQGLATFAGLSIDLVGSKQLRASASDYQSATSNSFAITPGPAARLRIQTEPSVSATAGVAFSQQPIIRVEDARGNLLTTDNSTVVTAARLAGAGTLQGILTATAKNGIVTFSNLSHTTANTISVLFTSGALTPDTSRSILVNPAAAARLAYVQQPTNTVAGAVILPAVTVALRDAFGNSVTTTGTTITVALFSGTGILSGTLSRSTTSGIATFNNLSINLTGPKTLRATSGSLTAAASNEFTILPGPAKMLVFVQQPTNAVAGSALSPPVTVQIRDSLGNNVAAPGVAVTLSLSSGTGTLSGATTRSTGSTGLATFSDLSVNLSGSKTLTASGSGLGTAVSTTFTIAPGTPARLAFVQQPTSTRAGASVTPAVTIQVRDAQGNNLRTAGISVSVTLSSGTGTLTGTTPQLTDASGIATFSNLSINLVGEKKLTASGAGLVSAVSQVFSISAAAASKLGFTRSPGGGSAGTPFVDQPGITLEDAFGNPVAGIAQTVTLAIQNNAGPGGTLMGTRSLPVNLLTGRADFTDISIDKAGNGYTLTVTGSTLSTTPGNVISAPFSVSAGSATTVGVENASDGTGRVLVSQNMTSGTSVVVYAISRDLYDNFVANIPADAWTLSSTSGGVVSTDLVVSADRKSATFTGRLAGTGVITAAVSGLRWIPSGTLTVVVAGVATQIRVETAANGTGTVVTDRNISSGGTLTAYAVGRDAAGNFVSNLAADGWSLQNRTGGVASADLVASADRKAATFTGKLLGSARIRATSGSLSATNSGVLTVVAGPATAMMANAGTPQSTRVGTAFPAKLSARVQDAAGNPVKGVQVVWSAPVSGASGTFTAGGSAASTDSNGVATSGTFTANSVAGTYIVVASLPVGSATAGFSLTNTFSGTATVRPAGGSPQQTQVTTQFPIPLAAIVSDSLGNPISGVAVTFAAPASGPGGTFPGGSRTTIVSTGSAGIAIAPVFTANTVAGTFQVAATTAGIADTARFDLTNTAGSAGTIKPTSGAPQSTTVGLAFATSLSATVADVSGNPMSGALVTFTTPPAGASAKFAGGLVDSALTNSAGMATSSLLTANTIPGTFSVLARTPGVSTPAAFLLTNQPGPVDTFLVDAAGGGKIGTQVAGVPFAIRVVANDMYGNTALQFNGTVDVSSNGVISPEGRLTIPFASGVLSSHSLSMQNGGNCILRVTRTGGAEMGRTDTFQVLNPVPTVTKLVPALGRRGQTLTIAITGSGFLPGQTTVSFGNLIATSTTVISKTELAVTIDIDAAAALGPRDVFVLNGPPGGGLGTLAGGFVVATIPPPTLTLVTPDRASVLQRLNVVFAGDNLLNGITRVDMGAGIIVNSIDVDSTNRLTADISVTTSAPEGTRRVFLSNDPPGGLTSDSINFRIVTPPTPYPIPESPADAAPLADTVVTFVWHPWLSAGIEYHLQVSTDPAFGTMAFEDSTIADTSRQVTSLAWGITYHWRVFARSELGNSEPSPARSFTASIIYPSNLGLSHTVSFPSYASGAGYHSSEYRLVGLPGDGDLPVNTVLSGIDGVDWVAYWDNGAVNNYLVSFDGTPTFDFSHGRAFWILHRGPVNISTSVPTMPLDSMRSAWVPLHPGWNLITNPFLSAVEWSSVKSANAPGLIADIWAYNGSFARSSNFVPYEGYMFDNAGNRTALRIPYGRTAAKIPARDDPALWRIDIELTCGILSDRATSIGLSAAAKRERDPLDLRMPRGVGEMPHVFFDRPGWDSTGCAFATDMRPVIDTLEIWPLKVRATAQEPAQLSFSGVPDVPAPNRVLLIDDDRGRSVDLRADPVYRFVPGLPVSRFRIVVGIEEAVGEVLEDLLPKEFAMESNFPNPFNSSTTIPLLLPRNSIVMLKVYTILGEEVKTLYSGPLEAGRQWITWEGTDGAGRPVSSGVYLVRLTTDGGQALIGKMLLMR